MGKRVKLISYINYKTTIYLLLSLTSPTSHGLQKMNSPTYSMLDFDNTGNSKAYIVLLDLMPFNV